MTWDRIAYVLSSFVLAACLLTGCQAEKDDHPADGIVRTQNFKTIHGLTVENGFAYDKAVVDLDGIKTVVVPEDATTQTGSLDGKMQIFMEKCLEFHGHPPEPMSIRWARNYMGCASKKEGDALTIATYGEWDTHKEGSAKMRVLIKIPEDVHIKSRQGLSGERSEGHSWKKNDKVKEGYWYGPASPGQGWEGIPSVPDPKLTARS